MTFESEEIKSIRESTRRFAEKEIPTFQNKTHFGTVPRELFKKFANLGLTKLKIPEAYGGTDSSNLCHSAVLEEIASVDLGATIFLSVHNMVSGLVSKYASEDQKKAYLPHFASGSKLAAFALTEPNAGSDASSLKTQAKKDGNNFILNGEKCYITSAGWADTYLLFAKIKEEIAAFIVDSNSPGLIISPPDSKMGAELSPIASLSLKNVEVPKEALVGKINDGYKIALSSLSSGRVSIASAAVGVGRSAIKLAAQHLNERKQFGKELINFQGLQFMLADMEMKYQASKALAYQAAFMLDNSTNKKEARKAASIAKCFATDSTMSITTDAVQLLGGAGYIKDYQVEKLMRDAKMLQIVEGTNQIQRVIIARSFFD